MSYYKNNYLRSLGYQGSLNDITVAFYIAVGATGNTLQDLETNLLDLMGIPRAALQDRWKQYLVNVGYVGDMASAWGTAITYDNVLSEWAKQIMVSDDCVVWRDLSDLSTLFQDSAGTTPVTGVGQPVGLMLDKSFGLVLGAELIPSLDFTTWGTSGLSSYTASSFTTSGAGGCFMAVPGWTGSKTYRLRITGTCTTTWNLRNTVASGYIPTYASGAFNVDIPLTQVMYASPNLFFQPTAAGTFTVTSISLKELPGNHAIQATPAARPTLESRYNLLTKTEQFDDAAWSKVGSTTASSANTINFPNFAEAISQAVVTTATVGTQAHFSVELSGSGTIYIGCYRAAGGAYEETKLKVTLTATPTIYSVSHTIANAGQTGFGGYISRSTDGTATTVTASKASLVHLADAHLPYQRVNTATDYDWDFSKFPPYLADDGIDDCHASVSTIDLTGTDKITVVGAWHKASDAADGVLLELSSIWTNNGAFGLFFPAAGGSDIIGFGSRGTAGALATKAGFPAPTTKVLTAIGDIPGRKAILRLNGVQEAAAPASQGTGTYGNYTLFESSRNKASARFKGRRYGYALFKVLLDSAKLNAVETYFKAKSKAY